MSEILKAVGDYGIVPVIKIDDAENAVLNVRLNSEFPGQMITEMLM